MMRQLVVLPTDAGSGCWIGIAARGLYGRYYQIYEGIGVLIFLSKFSVKQGKGGVYKRRGDPRPRTHYMHYLLALVRLEA